MRPRFPHRVRLLTPSPPSSDPATGNDSLGVVTEVASSAWLSQRPIRDTSFAEDDNVQGFTSSAYSLLLPPDVRVTAQTQVVDDQGALYAVEGDPALRRVAFTGRPLYIAASLRRLSDEQEA